MSDYCRTCDRNNPDENAELRGRVRDLEAAQEQNYLIAESNQALRRKADQRVRDLEAALRGYHDLAPAVAECVNECGEAVLYGELHRANRAADAALIRNTPPPADTKHPPSGAALAPAEEPPRGESREPGGEPVGASEEGRGEPTAAEPNRDATAQSPQIGSPLSAAPAEER